MSVEDDRDLETRQTMWQAFMRLTTWVIAIVISIFAGMAIFLL